MRRFANLHWLNLISASVLAQSPDVAVRVDANINYIVSTGASNRARWFDATGRHSVVGLGITLEPGYYILLTERMQRIKDDPDRQNLDEAYIEDPGLWRVGRQYLPFGSGRIFRESAFALRGNIDVIKGAPVSVAACDNGAPEPKDCLSVSDQTLVFPARRGVSLLHQQLHSPRYDPSRFWRGRNAATSLLLERISVDAGEVLTFKRKHWCYDKEKLPSIRLATLPASRLRLSPSPAFSRRAQAGHGNGRPNRISTNLSPSFPDPQPLAEKLRQVSTGYMARPFGWTSDKILIAYEHFSSRLQYGSGIRLPRVGPA